MPASSLKANSLSNNKLAGGKIISVEEVAKHN